MKPIDPSKRSSPISPTANPVQAEDAKSSQAASSNPPAAPLQQLQAAEAIRASETAIIEGLKQPIAKLAASFKLKKEALLAGAESELTDNDLKQYYAEVKKELAAEYHADLDQLAADFHGKNFADLSGLELMVALRKSGGAKLGDKFVSQIQDEALASDSFPEDLKMRLRQDVKKRFGTNSQRERLPLALVNELQQEVEDLLATCVEELGDKRFSVLGHGSFGVVAQVEEGDFKAILKLPIALEGTYFHEDFQQELDLLRSYQQRKQYPAVEIPELIYDSNGREVAQRGVYMLKKFQGGESLMKLNQKTSLEKDGELDKEAPEWQDIDKYLTQGLSDEFLSQYTEFFMEYAQEGISLDDIRFYNYFYNPEIRGLSLFEISINGELPDTVERRAVNLEHPLGAAIFSLMSHVYLFEPKHGYPEVLHDNIEHRAKEDFGIDDIFGQRFAQVKKVVEALVADSDLTKDQLIAELKFLQNPGSKFFELTDKGQAYIDEWLTTLQGHKS